MGRARHVKGVLMAVDSLSRRNFMKGAALTGVAAAAAGALASTGTALADEAEDAEAVEEEEVVSEESGADSDYDVIVIGMGFAGMTSAMSAADAGASVLIVDAAPDGVAGGNSRVCGQMFMSSTGDVEAAYNYTEALAGGMYLDEDRLQTFAEGIASIEDYIAKYGNLDSADFTDAMDVLGMGASYPEFPGGDVVSLWCATSYYGDSYLFEAEKTNLTENYADQIEIWYESPAKKLIQDPDTKTILGVVIEHEGEDVEVYAANGVVVAAGGYENNARMIQIYCNQSESAGYGSAYNQGDGILMCQAVGAQLDSMAPYATGGLAGCGYWVEDGEVSSGLSGAQVEGGMLSVGKEGCRWVNETATARYGMTSDKNGTWRNPRAPERVYAIYDQTQMDASEEEGGFSAYADITLQQFSSIEECADYIGCDADTLTETIESYNAMAEAGQDTEYERDPDTMRALDGEAYYVMRLKPLIAWTIGGPLRNVNCEIIDVFGDVIPNLYGAGEAGNMAVCMYQSGLAVADCFISGDIAGRNAAAAK